MLIILITKYSNYIKQTQLYTNKIDYITFLNILLLF